MNLRRPTTWFWIWAAGYGLLLTAIVWSLMSARDWALAELAAPESIAEWETWREDVRQQQRGPHSVERRVPKSAEPPTLVLLRDHFEVMLAGGVLFSSVLYWITAWFVTGMVRPGSSYTVRGAV